MEDKFEWNVPAHYSNPYFNLSVYKAAPDLYEAAKEARDYLRFNKGNASPIFDKLGRAIAKADS